VKADSLKLALLRDSQEYASDQYARQDSNLLTICSEKAEVQSDSATGRAAESGAVLPDSAGIDADLSALIEAWPKLPAAMRRRIMAMMRNSE
jgi:hypothetical protein